MTPDISIWTRNILVTLEIDARLDGGIPANPNLVGSWIDARNKEKAESARKMLKDATLAELPALTEEVADACYTVFKQDDKGSYYEGRCMKSALKEASNVLRELFVKAAEKSKDKTEKKAKGSPKAMSYAGLKSKCAEKVFVEEDKIYLRGPNGIIQQSELASEDRPIHVDTAQGPRTALKRVDFAPAGTRIQFTLRVLNDGQFDRKMLEYLFEYLTQGGIGANRSQGSGRFTVVSIEWPEKE